MEKKAVFTPGIFPSNRIVSGQRLAFSAQSMPMPARKNVFQSLSVWMVPTSFKISWKLGIWSRNFITLSNSARIFVHSASTGATQGKVFAS